MGVPIKPFYFNQEIKSFPNDLQQMATVDQLAHGVWHVLQGMLRIFGLCGGQNRGAVVVQECFLSNQSTVSALFFIIKTMLTLHYIPSHSVILTQSLLFVCFIPRLGNPSLLTPSFHFCDYQVSSF